MSIDTDRQRIVSRSSPAVDAVEKFDVKDEVKMVSITVMNDDCTSKKILLICRVAKVKTMSPSIEAPVMVRTVQTRAFMVKAMLVTSNKTD